MRTFKTSAAFHLTLLTFLPKHYLHTYSLVNKRNFKHLANISMYLRDTASFSSPKINGKPSNTVALSYNEDMQITKHDLITMEVEELEPINDYPGRLIYHQCFTFKRKLFVLGGYDWS